MSCVVIVCWKHFYLIWNELNNKCQNNKIIKKIWKLHVVLIKFICLADIWTMHLLFSPTIIIKFLFQLFTICYFSVLFILFCLYVFLWLLLLLLIYYNVAVYLFYVFVVVVIIIVKFLLHFTSTTCVCWS